MRKLPLTAVLKICLARHKKNQRPVPNEELLHLQDGNETFEGKSWTKARTRLRQKYPTRHSNVRCTASVTGRRRRGGRGP